MNTIKILNHKEVSLNQDARIIHELLDTVDKQNINQSAWPNTNYLGNCTFSILYGEDAIAIKYFVTEEQVKAIYNSPNDPVYKDSCVEFFISLDDKSYYNFEFNSNGTCLAQFGTSRENRNFLSASLISTIKTYKSLKTVNVAGNQLINWELTVIIPFTVFNNHSIKSFSGTEYRMNFYKCGDDLLEPHYLCWNKVETATPDFHRPDYFGLGKFSGE